MAQSPAEIARQLIDRHGPRAGAVAAEYAHEAELSGETAALDHWRAVQAAVMELKRRERQNVTQSVA